MNPSTPRARRGLCALALLAAAVIAAGCGASGGSSTPTTGGATSDAQNALDTAYRGVTGQPPATAPRVSAGKNIWVVSCGQVVPTCATPSQAVVDAAKAVGWSAKICDGQLNPNGWSACIRQGIGSKADAIVTIGQGCAPVKAALQEAKAADVTTIGVGGIDCDVTGGSKTFTAVTQQLGDRGQVQWWNTMGALQASWIIGKTQGRAKVLNVEFADELWGEWITAGFAKQLASCTGCQIVGKVRLTNQDLASNSLVTKFSTALLQHPDANAVAVPIDGWFHVGLAQAIMASGRSDELAVIGAFGEAGNLELIRAGRGEDATVATSLVWDGWAAVDVAIRLFAGQAVVPSGIGLQVVDADHGLPAAGQPFRYTPPVDFVAAYMKAWGHG
jgi:ribose transport system substrate-binding protein